MHEAHRLLGLISACTAFLGVGLALRKGVISNQSTPAGHHQSIFKFDKSKVGKCIYILLVIAVITYIVGYLVSNRVSTATGFCIVTTLFSSLGVFVVIAYVRK